MAAKILCRRCQVPMLSTADGWLAPVCATRTCGAYGKPCTVEHLAIEVQRLGGQLEERTEQRDAYAALLRRAETHLGALCRVGLHDHLAADLACAGCDLVRRIRAALEQQP